MKAVMWCDAWLAASIETDRYLSNFIIANLHFSYSIYTSIKQNSTDRIKHSRMAYIERYDITPL